MCIYIYIHVHWILYSEPPDCLSVPPLEPIYPEDLFWTEMFLWSLSGPHPRRWKEQMWELAVLWSHRVRSSKCKDGGDKGWHWAEPRTVTSVSRAHIELGPNCCFPVVKTSWFLAWSMEPVDVHHLWKLPFASGSSKGFYLRNISIQSVWFPVHVVKLSVGSAVQWDASLSICPC